MTETTITFNELGLPEFILNAVSEMGFSIPSPIQQACIPHLLNGHDVLGMAQTGSGKTAAFSLPLLAQIDTIKIKIFNKYLFISFRCYLNNNEILIEAIYLAKQNSI